MTATAPAVGERTRAKPTRIEGIDIARAVALIGMFTVHVSVYDYERDKTLGGAAGWWLDAPSGRASVLFMLLAGVSLSVIRGRGTASSSAAVIRRRGLVLIAGGLLLSATVWPASILEHYGMLFLIAPWLLDLRTRTLAVTTAVALAVGPILLLGAPAIDPTPEFGGPIMTWVVRTVSSLWLHGLYPLVVWFGIFCVGLLIGRIDLGSTRTAKRLLGGGLAAIAAVSLTVAGLGAAGIQPKDRFVETDGFYSGSEGSEFSEEWMVEESGSGAVETRPADSAVELLDTTPHSGRTAWVVQNLGISASILGLTLLVSSAARRSLRPLALLGSISLTAYLAHIALVGIYDAFVSESSLSLWAKFAALVSLQGCLVVLALVVRSRWRQGPFEWLLKQFTSRRWREA